MSLCHCVEVELVERLLECYEYEVRDYLADDDDDDDDDALAASSGSTLL